MKRSIYKDLSSWKLSPHRKPLIVQGARQTGKTYILKEFGHNEYDELHYFNFEEDGLLDSIFARDLDPTRLIRELSIYSGRAIEPERHLVFFDEIQASNNALNSLKYFFEKTPSFHLATAGSLLGLKVSSPKSFPVGKVDFLRLYPMAFDEFLEATGRDRYAKLLTGIEAIEPLSEVFHQELILALRGYFFCGGMPEAVSRFAETEDLNAVRRIQRDILDAYILDFAKHAEKTDIPRLSHVWESIPAQLARENKKFMFSAIRKSARARQYESAIGWLEDAGLIRRAFRVSSPRMPLKGYRDPSAFKVYSLDTGLLGAMAGLDPRLSITGDSAFEQYAGALTENYAAQSLASALEQPLSYWKADGGIAEVDFLLEIAGEILPLEIKAGVNLRSKSLRSYGDRYSPTVQLRSSLRNLRQDGSVCNIPLYALHALPQLHELFLKDSPGSG